MSEGLAAWRTSQPKPSRSSAPGLQKGRAQRQREGVGAVAGPAGHRAPEVLDDAVAAAHELHHDLLSGLGLEIQRDALLAAVERLKVAIEACAQHLRHGLRKGAGAAEMEQRCLRLCTELTVFAHGEDPSRIPGRALHLEHGRAEVREHHGGVRAVLVLR